MKTVQELRRCSPSESLFRQGGHTKILFYAEREALDSTTGVAPAAPQSSTSGCFTRNFLRNLESKGD